MARALHVLKTCRRFLTVPTLFEFSPVCQFCSKSRENVRVRFAPSPTGMLHLGGLRTALYNYLFAKSRLGKFVLRIEDTDQTRVVPGAVDKLMEDLAWAGLHPDEGPTIGGEDGPYMQSERLQLYKEMIKLLLKNGTAYHCFCSPRRLDLIRKEAVRLGKGQRYDNKCRHLSKEEVEEKISGNMPSVVRLKLEQFREPWKDLVYGPIVNNVAEYEGDLVLLKSDGYPTYHFANVVDDHHMRITHVLRGEEWQISTVKHLLLYRAFGWDPPQFAHLPLLLNKEGTKLSKRQGDIHVESFREKGYYPEAVLNFITSAGSGFTQPVSGGLTLQQLISRFSLDKVTRHSGRVEMEKLDLFNRLHLERLYDSDKKRELVEQIRNLITTIHSHRLVGDSEMQKYILSDDYITRVLEWSLVRIFRLEDLASPEFEFVWFIPGANCKQDLRNLHSDPMELLQQSMQIIESAADVTDQSKTMHQLRTAAKEQDLKFPVYMKFLRMALSGLKEGPSVTEMISILGKDGTLLRLNHTYDLLKGS